MESTWVGLEDLQGAGDQNLVQAGTEADCNGGASCSPSYYAFYDLVPAAQVQCTGSNSVTIKAGDVIYTFVTNEAISGGSNSKYDINVLDWKSLQACMVAGLSYPRMTSPTQAAYIAENTYSCNYPPTVCASLPKFGTITFSYARMYAGGVYHYIYYFTSKAWDFEDIMENAPGTYPNCGSYVIDVQPGSVSSGSSFSDPWSSSAYTPGYLTNC